MNSGRQIHPSNGFLLIDKPTGMTSHDVVRRLRRILLEKTIGHAGTLDPAASGLLVMLVGQATKLSNFILEGDKTYEIEVSLGETTATGDATGEKLEVKKVEASEDEVRDLALSMVGELNLKVPIYAAVKVKGKKLYEYAREKVEVEVPERVMSFYEVKWLGMSESRFRVTIRCSKGTYVRAWAVELGLRLGCGAHISSLRRLKSEPYSLSDSIGLDAFDELVSSEGRVEALRGPHFIEMSEVLPHYRPVQIQGRDELLLMNGQVSHQLQQRLILAQKESFQTKSMVGIRVLSQRSGRLLGILEARPGEGLRIKRVFPNPEVNLTGQSLSR